MLFLNDLYTQKGLSAAQIAKEFSSSKSSVLKALRHFEIPIREPHLPHGRHSQTRYGERRFKEKTAPFKKEERVVKTITELAKEGLSYRRICEILTNMKVPTKNKGRKWHPEMIRRILRNHSS